MLAAAVDNAEGVDALLDAGASVELADALGRTALMFAAGRGAPCALIALLRAGASVRSPNSCHPFQFQTGNVPPSSHYVRVYNGYSKTYGVQLRRNPVIKH